MPNHRQKILIIGMVNSVHLAGWISQFVDQPIDFVIFPSTQAQQAHPIIENLMKSKTNQMSISLQPVFMRRHAFVLTVLDIPFKNRFRSHILRKLITEHSFDLIHVLELQHAGYLLLGTRLAPNLPKFLLLIGAATSTGLNNSLNTKQKLFNYYKLLPTIRLNASVTLRLSNALDTTASLCRSYPIGEELI